MGKFLATYEFELDGGDIPDHAVAEMLLHSEQAKSDCNVWELSSPTLVMVQVKE